MFRASPASASWIWSIVVAFGFLLWARSAQGTFARHKPEMVPVAALNKVLELNATWQREHGRPAVIFHSYNWGGYLIWHGWPGMRDWIDDRNEVQGEAHIRDYFTVVEAAPGWQERLAGADLVAVPPDIPLVAYISMDRGWSEEYRDSSAVVFRRSSTRLAQSP